MIALFPKIRLLLSVCCLLIPILINASESYQTQLCRLSVQPVKKEIAALKKKVLTATESDNLFDRYVALRQLVADGHTNMFDGLKLTGDDPLIDFIFQQNLKIADEMIRKNRQSEEFQGAPLEVMTFNTGLLESIVRGLQYYPTWMPGDISLQNYYKERQQLFLPEIVNLLSGKLDSNSELGPGGPDILGGQELWHNKDQNLLQQALEQVTDRGITYSLVQPPQQDPRESGLFLLINKTAGLDVEEIGFSAFPQISLADKAWRLNRWELSIKRGLLWAIITTNKGERILAATSHYTPGDMHHSVIVRQARYAGEELNRLKSQLNADHIVYLIDGNYPANVEPNSPSFANNKKGQKSRTALTALAYPTMSGYSGLIDAFAATNNTRVNPGITDLPYPRLVLSQAPGRIDFIWTDTFVEESTTSLDQSLQKTSTRDGQQLIDLTLSDHVAVRARLRTKGR